MTLKLAILLAGFAGVLGIALGWLLRWAISISKKTSVELTVKQKMLEAETEAQKKVTEAEKKAFSMIEESKSSIKDRELQMKKLEDRLMQKDELLDKRQTDIEKEVENIKERVVEIKQIKENVKKLEADRLTELERVAKLSEEEAKKEVMSTIERNFEQDFMQRMQKLERDGQERLDRKAKDILSTSVQRLATSTASDFMTTAVKIESDEIKGKIIGKEGRNIRAFERSAGVDLIIDDTPGFIIISSFDPVRRHIAKMALENLIQDGRIQPAKIEEMVEKAKTEINKIIKDKGEAAAYEAGAFNLDPRLLLILGRLHFRTSFGQNVLQHSIEMTHIAAMLAEELGADIQIARAGALLHDIGKAVDHEVVGTHVEIGRRILQKLNADERIIKAMQSHHEEYPYETIESIIVQTADAISAGRPGARRDSVENYIKRLQDLEAIANSFPGVEKCYAIQAGREVRIFVTPDKITDMEAKKMAREIANRVEQELKYPGEIKVNVIRELRSIEFAR
ncbi:MAG: ribonuclease Y [Candidatus Vogelbacteria bacterium]|nr:ribonuclease Y [Candidatus Vogelbacteria bacterium]